MAIKHRIVANPASLDEMIDDAVTRRSPRAEARALWFREHLESTMEKFGLEYDRVLSRDDTINYHRLQATQNKAEEIAELLSKKFKIQFSLGRPSTMRPFHAVSGKVMIDKQYVYFTVSYSQRTGLSVATIF